jgi:hypothetical protein
MALSKGKSFPFNGKELSTVHNAEDLKGGSNWKLHISQNNICSLLSNTFLGDNLCWSCTLVPHLLVTYYDMWLEISVSKVQTRSW